MLAVRNHVGIISLLRRLYNINFTLLEKLNYFLQGAIFVNDVI